jgi:subtilisin family serine protease
MRRVGPVMTLPSVRRSTAALAGLLLAVGGTALTAPAAAAPPEKTAVIVQLKPGSDAAAEARRASANGGGAVSAVYGAVFSGFAGEFTEGALNGLRHNPRVVLIESDGVATTTAVDSWGLDRIDQRALPLNQTYTPAGTGSGVTAYVIDTGLAPHPDLDQVGAGADFVKDGRGTVDCDGHGTHVAGTVAGNRFGVAKETIVVPVRVLDCTGSGSWSGVIAGINWAANHHQPGVPAVANMSLGGSGMTTVDDAVKALVRDGVTVAVAAGNSHADACRSTPARVPEALTVGATDNRDQRASFSNYGRCLDLFAPGVNIVSSWLAGATNTISGTSMASPHVAGAAALALSRQPTLTPAQVAAQLDASVTRGVVGKAGNASPNELLYVGA